ncbi:acyl-CoA dehydrogenase [Rhizocola hellebori]|uniref:Acyl-CoA dehydrogenase n=1 Tax=Rhizocola hellebori TaxID=1392758 RepID=A0A8J3VHQ0_9ACTN|nr:acyl-CoA dehydrogenase [Rhizocola hellebori]GIH06251.1 acyl-CoA dehydrogenase [Rhizocola hellebori]
MPIAITEEQRAMREAIRSSGALSWPDLGALGIFGMAIAEELGGAGGTAEDLAAALEQVTDSLAPGPILSTLVAGLAIPSPEMAAGKTTVALGLDPGSLTLIGGRASGRTRLVLGAGEASQLLLTTPDGQWFLVEAEDAEIIASEALDLSRGLGEVTLSNVAATAVPARVLEIAATLFCVEAAGVAGWCERTATDYAKIRQQFGRPIGSFQAVKHLCAQMRCRYEAAMAVAWDAARALDQAPHEHELAAAVAASIALDAAVDNAKDCIQVLGGIGFTWEHPAHRYLRRALSLRHLLGGSAVWRIKAAELALAGQRRHLSVDLGDTSAIKAVVQGIAALPEEKRREALADAGYLTPLREPKDQLAVDEELARAGIAKPDLVIGGWAVPTIMRHGTEAQKERFTGPTLRGEITWCQLFSEPEAGSDLAALRTRAERVEGGWHLTGQKVWTSLAREADWAICLARTDPAVPKHKGITYFLVSMDSPGIEIRPLREITGKAVFNEVFLDGVFVPDDCVVGAPGDGWRLARSTLASERVAMGRGSSLGEAVEGLLRGADGPSELLGSLVAEGLSVSLLDQRATMRQLAGQEAGADSAVRKLIGVHHRQAVAEAALLLCGPQAAAVTEHTAEPIYQFLLTRCLSIAGGTTQILLTLVGERVLGLPREA